MYNKGYTKAIKVAINVVNKCVFLLAIIAITVVINTITTSTAYSKNYRHSKQIVLINVHNKTISGLEITGGKIPPITLKNCSNIKITGSIMISAALIFVRMFCIRISSVLKYFASAMLVANLANSAG